MLHYLCLSSISAQSSVWRSVALFLQDLFEIFAADDRLDMLEDLVAVGSAPIAGIKSVSTYKSLKGTKGIFSLLQYDIKSESPFAISLANSTSACLAADKSDHQYPPPMDIKH